MTTNPHYGSDFDEFLREEGILEEVEETAMERVMEWCKCRDCSEGGPHRSDCAVHNAPAYPKGPCNCGHKTSTAVKLLRGGLNELLREGHIGDSSL